MLSHVVFKRKRNINYKQFLLILNKCAIFIDTIVTIRYFNIFAEKLVQKLRHDGSHMHLLGILIVFLGILRIPNTAYALRLRGQWHPTVESFHFLARFATEGKSRDLGVEPLEGFAFGNITLSFMQSLDRARRSADESSVLTGQNNATEATGNVTSSTEITTTMSTTTTTVSPLQSLDFRLLLADQDHFYDVYSNRTVTPLSKACPLMMNRLGQTSFDRNCNPGGRFDLLRTVPCMKGHCLEEDNPSNVVKGYQFTFRFHDNQPRVWYLALVACNRDAQCQWQPSKVDPQLGEVILDYGKALFVILNLNLTFPSFFF